MKERLDEFYICDEDDIYDESEDLYEDIREDVYSDVPGLDPNLPWYEDDIDDMDDADLEEDASDLDEDYGTYNLNFDCGDILLASVYQDGDNRNLRHKRRPFLVIYANAYRVYGFQLTSSSAASLLKYKVPVQDWQQCGLIKPSGIMTNMVRGVTYDRLRKYIGHISEKSKKSLLNKLYEIRENKNGKYDDCPLFDREDRIENTIKNVRRIRSGVGVLI